MSDEAFSDILTAHGGVGVGGALSGSALSALQDGLRGKVHAASLWMAELAEIASADEVLPYANARGRLAAYLALRYLSSLSALVVALCKLKPRQEHIQLFRELALFLATAGGGGGDGGGGGGGDGGDAAGGAAVGRRRRRRRRAAAQAAAYAARATYSRGQGRSPRGA